MAENFEERLKQTKLKTKDEFVDFAEKIYFDEKLKNINKKVTSNKTKHEEGEQKLNHLS